MTRERAAKAIIPAFALALALVLASILYLTLFELRSFTLRDLLRDGRSVARVEAQLTALTSDPLLAWRSWQAHQQAPALAAASRTAGLIAISVAGLASIATAVWLWPRPLPRPWDARFAGWADLTRAAGLGVLNARHGLLLTKVTPGWRIPVPAWGRRLPTDPHALWRWRSFGGRRLRARDSRHLVVVGSTRSGKGVGVIIPNLLDWRGAALVIDVKGEAHAATAGWRATVGPVFRFAPFRADGRSHRINPLEFVSRDPRFQPAELQKLAAFLLPYPLRESPFWTDTARGLFVGIAAHVLEGKAFDGRRTLGTVYDLFSVKGGFTEYVADLIEKDVGLSDVARRGLQEYLNIRSDKTQGSVVTQVTNALRVLQNPLFRNATAASDVTLDDLMRKPATLYIEMSVTEIDELAAPFLRLLLQQLIDAVEREKGLKGGGRLQLVLDEFERIGKLDVIVNNFPYISGFGVQIVAILQNLSKLFDVYGQNVAQSLLGSAAYQLVLGVNDSVTAQHYAALCGRASFATRNRTIAKPTWNRVRQESESESLTPVPLMGPEKIREMPLSRALLFVEGAPPAYVWRMRYFEEGRYRRRSGVKAPTIPVAAEAPERFQLIETPSSQQAASAAPASATAPSKAAIDPTFGAAAFDRPEQRSATPSGLSDFELDHAVQAEIGRLFDEHDAGLKGAVDALLAEPGVDRAEVESIMEEFEAERVNSE
jgi:type IV secretion system protein VirD4